MARQLFGTDGIRGVAGEYPLDPKTAHALGVALGQWTRKKTGAPSGSLHEASASPDESCSEVVIGMDTRESGPWLAEQVAGGLDRAGVRSRFAGLMTTPGVAYLARTGPFAAGVMISASHNPYHDNGIKIIDHSGYKLPDDQEMALEDSMFNWISLEVPPTPKTLQVDGRLDRSYVDHLSTKFRGSLPVKIVVDCANGAATHLAPQLFERLGAEVVRAGCSPNGQNINLDCGSLHLDALQAKVLEHHADLGVAFDGDADRALFVSGRGNPIDGDGILLLTAVASKRQGRLAKNLVIATVMSNMGLEKALAGHGIRMERTPVGDKYVLEEMMRSGAVLGGEQSGHILFLEDSTTGDGLLTALRVLEVMRDSKLDLDELTSEFDKNAQLRVDVPFLKKRPLAELDSVNHEILKAEQAFGDSGRVLVRFSGTEPLARVLVEGPDMERVEGFANRIADAIRRELGSKN